MDKPLKRASKEILFYYQSGKRVEGKNPAMTGNCSELWGDCSELRGNCSGLRGICSGLRGDCPDLKGDLDLITVKQRGHDADVSSYVEDKE